MDIYLSPLVNIGGIYTALPHVTPHYSLFTHQHHGWQRCKLIYMEKKSKAKKKSLLKKENQRCPGCLNKSCPKKFNNNEDKCGES